MFSIVHRSSLVTVGCRGVQLPWRCFLKWWYFTYANHFFMDKRPHVSKAHLFILQMYINMDIYIYKCLKQEINQDSLERYGCGDHVLDGSGRGYQSCLAKLLCSSHASQLSSYFLSHRRGIGLQIARWIEVCRIMFCRTLHWSPH